MRQAYFVAGLLLGIALTVFALQNTAPVEVRFLLWNTQGPLAAVVLVSAIGGLVVALLFGLPEVLSARWRIRTLERRLEGERLDSREREPTGGPEGPTPGGP